MLEKICTICNKSFKAEKQEYFSKHFFYDKKGKHKHNARCKSCCRKIKQDFYKKYPEKMNPNYIKKRINKNCIVCRSDFLARESKHICCSDECREIKNKVRKRIDKDKHNLAYKIRRHKDIEKSTIRFKHYSEKEINIISNMLAKGYDYSRIAKKLGRTTVGIGKIARKIKKSKINI